MWPVGCDLTGIIQRQWREGPPRPSDRPSYPMRVEIKCCSAARSAVTWIRHSFPTRRSSDLLANLGGLGVKIPALETHSGDEIESFPWWSSCRRQEDGSNGSAHARSPG